MKKEEVLSKDPRLASPPIWARGFLRQGGSRISAARKIKCERRQKVPTSHGWEEGRTRCDA